LLGDRLEPLFSYQIEVNFLLIADITTLLLIRGLHDRVFLLVLHPVRQGKGDLKSLILEGAGSFWGQGVVRWRLHDEGVPDCLGKTACEGLEFLLGL